MAVQAPLEHYLMRALITCLLLAAPAAASAGLYITIVRGLDGTPAYGKQFDEQEANLREASESVAGDGNVKVFSGGAATRENIRAHFEALAKKLAEDDRLALMLVGHGSYDGYEYKFNIPGPDLTGDDIAALLDAQPARIQLLVNTSGASGAVVDALKRESRIVITATRSGNERLAPRFGAFLAEAFADPAADVNKNNAITAQEAFDYASRRVQDHFEREGQLATEHPVIEGVQAGQFVLARLDSARPAAGTDPAMVKLINRRNEIDRQVEDLQLRKGEMESAEYLDRLQQLMIDMSLVQGEIDDMSGAEGSDAP